jgi:hypothetical protein
MKKIGFSLLFALIVLCSCEEPKTDVQLNPPKCQITDHKFTKAIVYPSTNSTLDLTISNYSSKYSAIEVSLYVKVKSGNLIIEEKPSFVAIGINAGEKIKKQISLYNVKSDTYVSNIEVKLVWKDIEDFYHSESYNFPL